MTPLWTSESAAAATGGDSRGAFAATGLSIDSRTLARGDLFIALSGPTFDGHDYVGAAADKGAAGAVVARPVDSALPQIVVGDTLEALTALAHAARARARARTIAITGSVGKTGTRAMCARAFAALGSVHASGASHNNHVGLPLTLARLRPERDFAVLEMGMNHPGEIAALTAVARPDVAIITAVAPAHMEFFRDLAEIADAKAEIFEGVTPGGAAVLNRNDANFGRLAAAARARGVERVVGFGSSSAGDVVMRSCAAGPESSFVRAAVAGAELNWTVGIPGRHWAHNSLAAVAAVHALGGDCARAAATLANLESLPGRGRRFPAEVAGGSVEVIDEAYNASPASMAAAFDLLALVPARGRRIAVLGDMLELGARASAFHAALAGDAERAGIDLVFTAGPSMAALNAALPPARRGAHAPDSAALAPIVCAGLRPHDVVLVKGSRGAAMERVVAALESQCAAAAEGAVDAL